MENTTELLEQRITKEIQRMDTPLFAVFDFDNTCIMNDITEATLAYLAVNNLFKDTSLLEGTLENYSKSVFQNYYHMLREGRTKEAYSFAVKIISGFSINDIAPLVDEVIRFKEHAHFNSDIWGVTIPKGMRLRKEVINLMSFLKNLGVDIWVISASPEALVRQTMDYFNIEANLIGVKNSIVNGTYTGNFEEPVSMFEGKVDCIKKFIHPDQRPIFGIGDSMNDLPMLEYCTIKAVVNRNNSLAEKAKELNWFLYENI
jgi:HAD superfamily phosphoserine phosphatase-like hydrolase